MKRFQPLSLIATLLLATLSLHAQDATQTARKVVVGVANAGVTGTTKNRLAKLTGAPSRAVIAATSDVDGILGVVTSNSSTTGLATIQTAGLVNCDFDGATVAGDFVQISSSSAGKCHASGSTYPTSGQVLGRVLSTNVGAGTYQLALVSITKASAGGGAAYLVYTALLNQSGTDAPVATVLQNTLGGTVVWTRSTTGVYVATLAGVFTVGKTVVFATPTRSAPTSAAHVVEVVANASANSITVVTSKQDAVNGTGAELDSLLVNVPVRIEVYP